ncbi:hypothetical protein Gotur_022611 [Gossypium turneri]
MSFSLFGFDGKWMAALLWIQLVVEGVLPYYRGIGALFIGLGILRVGIGWWGDFNEIMDNSEKFGMRGHPRVFMDNFWDVMDDLALIDVKPDKGWFTWSNNREGNKVFRQTCSDHDAILFDTLGRKPMDDIKDSMLFFQFEAYWAKEDEAKDLIKRVWDQCNGMYDALLFICNKMEEVEIVKDILHYFETIFGQKINPSKSIVYFSLNTLRDQSEQLSGILARYGFNRWGFEGLDVNLLRTSFSGIWDGLHGPPDRIIWFHNKSGCYSSKYKYSWLILKKMGFGLRRLFWRTIWKLRVLPKICIFAWRVGHNFLLTNVKIASVIQGFDWVCHMYGTGDETIIHALRDYPKARAVLSSGGLDGRLLDSNFESCIDWLEDATCFGKEEDARLIWEWARTLGADFRIFNLSHIAMNPRPPRSYKWVKPQIDVIKINIDATIHDTVVAIETIARDNDVFVLGGRVVYLDYKMDVQWAEAEALREGFVWVRGNNVARAIFETDYAGLVNWFRFRREDISIFRFQLKNIFNLLDSSIEFEIEWVAGSSNRVADGLCKLAIDKRCTFSFNMEYSSDIQRLVLIDAY